MKNASSMAVSTSTAICAPVMLAEVICSEFALIAVEICLAKSVIWVSVRCSGPVTSQSRSWFTPSCTCLVTDGRLVVTCHTTNQPTSPMPARPLRNVPAAASDRGTPCRRSQETVGSSSAEISSEASTAKATSRSMSTTRNTTYRAAPSSSSRQVDSAATRRPHGTASAGVAGRPGCSSRPNAAGAACWGRGAPELSSGLGSGTGTAVTSDRRGEGTCSSEAVWSCGTGAGSPSAPAAIAARRRRSMPAAARATSASPAAVAVKAFPNALPPRAMSPLPPLPRRTAVPAVGRGYRHSRQEDATRPPGRDSGCPVGWRRAPGEQPLANRHKHGPTGGFIRPAHGEVPERGAGPPSQLPADRPVREAARTPSRTPRPHPGPHRPRALVSAARAARPAPGRPPTHEDPRPLSGRGSFARVSGTSSTSGATARTTRRHRGCRSGCSCSPGPT